MTDIDTTQTDAAPAGDEELDVSPEDMISRGKGLKLDAIPEGSPAEQAVEDFRKLQTQLQEADAAAKALLDERNQAIYKLKSDHNVGFTAIGELIGGTSSLALYLYERAQGKSAKQIREESKRSRAAKEKFLEKSEGSANARKQTPEEKAFRKQQKDALKAFLEAQKAESAGSDDGAEEADDE